MSWLGIRIFLVKAGRRNVGRTNYVLFWKQCFDFLSWLAKDNLELPSTDVCVLNSVTNTTRALPYLSHHKTLICCLDNDEAGRGALETLRSLRKDLRNAVIIDGSLFYYGYKDVNEWWVAMKDK